jgi:hypothetical protein
MREIGGLLLLALAVAIAAWGLWNLCGARRRARGIKIRLPDDER